MEAARNQGLELFAISQLCFQAEPIIAMIGKLRAKGYDKPIRLGLAGPASFKTLIRFAAICGVGASTKALVSRGSMIAKLLTETGPDPVIRALAEERALDGLGPLSLHFFPFGGLEKTARWAAARRRGPLRDPGAGRGIPGRGPRRAEAPARSGKLVCGPGSLCVHWAACVKPTPKAAMRIIVISDTALKTAGPRASGC